MQLFPSQIMTSWISKILANLINPFFYMTKKSQDKNLSFLENEKSF